MVVQHKILAMKKLHLILLSFLFFASSSACAKDSLEQLGDLGQYALPYSALMLSISDKQYDDTRQFAYRYATSLAIMYSTKYLVNAERPNGAGYSFPSGHTTSSFAGAAFIQSEYGWKWGVPAYLLASYVGWSRINANKHWPRDVYAGAALAIGVNYGFRLFNKPASHLFVEYGESHIAAHLKMPI